MKLENRKKVMNLNMIGKGMINKQRILYASITLLLLVIEIMIALFARDMLIRGRVGDVLVVILLYTFVRSFVPDRIRLLPLYVFLFACFAEFLQYIHIVERLGLEHNAFFKTLLGSVFDWFDVLSYGIGCILTGVYEVLIRTKSSLGRHV